MLVTAPKSDRMNRFEGFALIALLQGFPIFASTVLLMKLIGSHQIVSERFGAAIFVALATPLYAWVTPVLVRKFPKLFRNSHEPAVLRCQPVVLREDRAMADATESVVATAGDGDHAVAAGGRGGEHGVAL